MIENYQAHAANERTFLAWVRTAISIVGFGILIDRLDGSGGAQSNFRTIALIGLGGALIIFSALRFNTLNRRIASKNEEKAFASRFNIVFSVMIITLVLLLATFALHVA